MVSQCFTVYDVLRRNSISHPGGIALVCGAERLSFTALTRQIEACAAGLWAQGVCPGSRVVVAAKNCHRYLWLVGACAALDAAMVPVGGELGPAGIRGLLEDTGPAATVVDPSLEKTVVEHCAKGTPTGRLLSFSPGEEAFICLDSCLDERGYGRHMAEGGDPFLILPGCDPQGRLRLSVLSHGNALCAAMQLVAALSLSPTDICLAAEPFSTPVSLILSLAVLAAGGRVVIPENAYPATILGDIEKEKATVMAADADMLKALAQARVARSNAAASLRACLLVSGPESLGGDDSDLYDIVYNIFPKNETGGVLSLGPRRESPKAFGRPGILADVTVADEVGRPAPAGDEGPVIVRGPLVFSGYWEKGRINKKPLAEGFFRTGDRGFYDHDGLLHITAC